MAGYLACLGCFLGLLFWQLAEQEEKDFAIKVGSQQEVDAHQYL
jgi:hypothetical protein